MILHHLSVSISRVFCVDLIDGIDDMRLTLLVDDEFIAESDVIARGLETRLVGNGSSTIFLVPTVF